MPHTIIYIKLKKSHSQENLFHNKAGYKMILCTITVCPKKKCIGKTPEGYRTKC